MIRRWRTLSRSALKIFTTWYKSSIVGALFACIVSQDLTSDDPCCCWWETLGNLFSRFCCRPNSLAFNSDESFTSDVYFTSDEIFCGNAIKTGLMFWWWKNFDPLENDEQWSFILVATIFPSRRRRFVERELVFLVQSKHRVCMFSYLWP